MCDDERWRPALRRNSQSQSISEAGSTAGEQGPFGVPKATVNLNSVPETVPFNRPFVSLVRPKHEAITTDKRYLKPFVTGLVPQTVPL
jgi:hypothetical protein